MVCAVGQNLKIYKFCGQYACLGKTDMWNYFMKTK